MGLVKDPGLEGVTLAFTTEGGKASLAVEGTRRLLGTEMQAQLRQVGAVGLYTKLAEDVAVGGRVPFDGDSLLATLVGSSGPISGLQGDLVLDRVDPAQECAFLSGTIGFTEEVDKEGVRFAAKYRVTLSLEVDLETHDVVRAALQGGPLSRVWASSRECSRGTSTSIPRRRPSRRRTSRRPRAASRRSARGITACSAWSSSFRPAGCSTRTPRTSRSSSTRGWSPISRSRSR